MASCPDAKIPPRQATNIADLLYSFVKMPSGDDNDCNDQHEMYTFNTSSPAASGLGSGGTSGGTEQETLPGPQSGFTVTSGGGSAGSRVQGQLTGVGPKCQRNIEQGLYDKLVCQLEIWRVCVQEFYDGGLRECRKAASHQNKPENYTGVTSYENAWEQGGEDQRATYEDCLRAAEEAKVCDCRNCRYPIGGGNNTPENPEVDDTPVDGDTFGQLRTTSNYALPIHRVFGRFIVPGNIVWIGNKQTEAITWGRKAADGTITVIDETLTTVDLIVSLGAAPIDHVLRIWAEDQLIYNRTESLDGVTSLNLAAMAGSDYDMARTNFYHPTIEVLNTHQKRSAAQSHVAADVGTGNAPSMDDLALVLIRDVDLLLFGGSFPDLKFDVSTDADESVPYTASTNVVNLSQSYLDVDMRTETVYVKDTSNNVKMFDLRTLDELYASSGTAYSNVLVLKSGNIVVEDTTAKVLCTPKNIIRRNLGVALGSHSVSYLANSNIYKGQYDEDEFGEIIYTDEEKRMNRDITEMQVEFIIVLDSNGDWTWIEYDFVEDYEFTIWEQTATVGYQLQAAVIGEVSDSLYLYQFLFDATTQNSLRIDRYHIRNSAGSVPCVYVLSPTFDFVYEDGFATYSVDKIAWGGTNTGITIRQVIRDPKDNGYIVFFSNNFVTKLSSTFSIVWTEELVEALATHNNQGRMAIGVMDYYAYITNAGNIVHLNLETGASEVVNSLTGLGLPGLGGAQYFDGRNGSILYISSDATRKLVRATMNVITPNKVTFSHIFDTIMDLSRMDSTYYDNSDLDVEIDGYLIDDTTAARDLLTPLMQLYGFLATDNGDVLSVIKGDALPTAVDIDQDDDVIGVELDKEFEKVSHPLARMKVTFYNVNDEGLETMTQSVTLVTYEDDIRSEHEQTILLNDTATNIRNNIEKFLHMDALDHITVAGDIMPDFIGLTPTDPVTVDDASYRVRRMNVSEKGAISIMASKHEADYLVTSANLSSYSLFTSVATDLKVAHPRERPIVLFTNAVNDADMETSVRGQVVYTGIDTPNRLNPPAGNAFIVRLLDAFDPTIERYPTQEHTEGVHVGVLQSDFPDAEENGLWTLDRTTQLVIKFDHADTASFCQTFSNPYDVLEPEVDQTTNLLIIGREYVRFANYSVAGDGKTVTFTNLYRGVQGTNPYAMEHFQGQKCYLFTEDSFKRLYVNPFDTHYQPKIKIYYPRFATAGSAYVNFGRRADAGAARPWSCTDVNTTFEYNPLDGNYPATITWQWRRNFFVDHSNSNEVSSDWPEAYAGSFYNTDTELTHTLGAPYIAALDRFYQQSYYFEFDTWDERQKTFSDLQFFTPVATKGRIIGYPPGPTTPSDFFQQFNVTNGYYL